MCVEGPDICHRNLEKVEGDGSLRGAWTGAVTGHRALGNLRVLANLWSSPWRVLSFTETHLLLEALLD